MNRVFLVGNLTRDPRLREINDRMTVADLGLAVNEKFRKKDGEQGENTCFVDITVWNGQARACGKVLKKGMPVMVEGKLQFEQWTDQEGGKKSKLKVTADRVQFLRPPAKEPEEQPVEA